jgi:hypothetical protein
MNRWNYTSFSLHDFMVCTGVTLPLLFPSHVKHTEFYCTVRLESRYALIKCVDSDVHECLYMPEPI